MIYLELFYVFFLIGLFTFGGGYAMIPLIEEKTLAYGWLTEAEFQNMIAIAESTPGPVAVNMATFVGNLNGGILGAFLSTLGVILPSFIIILLIATILKHLIDRPTVKAILHGFQGIVIGLIAATALWFLYQNVISVSDTNEISFLIKPLIIFVIVLITSIVYKLISKKSISPYFLLIEGGVLGLVIFYAIPLIF